MAKREKTIVIDGYAQPVADTARITDVVPVEASEIITRDGKVIPRSHFANTPVPDGFDVYLSQINKGA